MLHKTTPDRKEMLHRPNRPQDDSPSKFKGKSMNISFGSNCSSRVNKNPESPQEAVDKEKEHLGSDCPSRVNENVESPQEAVEQKEQEQEEEKEESDKEEDDGEENEQSEDGPIGQAKTDANSPSDDEKHKLKNDGPKKNKEYSHENEKLLTLKKNLPQEVLCEVEMLLNMSKSDPSEAPASQGPKTHKRGKSKSLEQLEKQSERRRFNQEEKEHHEFLAKALKNLIQVSVKRTTVKGSLCDLRKLQMHELLLVMGPEGFGMEPVRLNFHVDLPSVEGSTLGTIHGSIFSPAALPPFLPPSLPPSLFPPSFLRSFPAPLPPSLFPPSLSLPRPINNNVERCGEPSAVAESSNPAPHEFERLSRGQVCVQQRRGTC